MRFQSSRRSGHVVCLLNFDDRRNEVKRGGLVSVWWTVLYNGTLRTSGELPETKLPLLFSRTDKLPPAPNSSPVSECWERERERRNVTGKKCKLEWKGTREYKSAKELNVVIALIPASQWKPCLKSALGSSRKNKCSVLWDMLVAQSVLRVQESCWNWHRLESNQKSEVETLWKFSSLLCRIR